MKRRPTGDAESSVDAGSRTRSSRNPRVTREEYASDDFAAGDAHDDYAVGDYDVEDDEFVNEIGSEGDGVDVDYA